MSLIDHTHSLFLRANSPFADLQSRERNGVDAERSSKSIERVLDFLQERLSDNVSNEQLAEIAHLSPFHFNRRFRLETGVPPRQFQSALRIHRAKELLACTDASVTNVCFEVGFTSLGTFSTRFHALVGVSPYAFRRLAHIVRSMPAWKLLLTLRHKKPLQQSERRVAGRAVVSQTNFNGVVVCALFGKRFPGGAPVDCCIATEDYTFELNAPTVGMWYVMALAIPFTSDPTAVLTSNDLWRGRSGQLVQSNEIYHRTFALAPPRRHDPPILTVLPGLSVLLG